jgi:hypothetical protein
MSPRPSRESDVLRMLSQGFDNPQIASRLGLSLGRVKNIVTGILAKHGARDRKELRQMLLPPIVYDGNMAFAQFLGVIEEQTREPK